MPKILKTGKRNDKKHNKPLIYCMCALKGLLGFGVAIALMGVIILKKAGVSDGWYYISYIGISLGGFICGFSAHKKINGRGFINGLIASFAYCAIMIVLLMIISGFKISPSILIIVPICLISGFVGGTIGANT